MVFKLIHKEKIHLITSDNNDILKEFKRTKYEQYSKSSAKEEIL